MDLKDKQAVRETIESYMACWESKDTALFSTLFHESFLMVGRRGDEFVISDTGPMLKRIQSSDASWNEYRAEITNLQVAGPIANVTLEEFGFLDLRVLATSYYQLINEDGHWKIIAKTFHYHHEE